MLYGFLLEKYVGVFYSLFLIYCQVNGQLPSPCPDIFEYEKTNHEAGEWTGKVSLTTKDELNGVWLHIGLDNEAQVLINWFGESTTKDNKDFIIKNGKRNLIPGEPPIILKFTIKYDTTLRIPSLARIRLNGRTICTKPATSTEYVETSTVYVSERVTERTPNNQQSRPQINQQQSRPQVNQQQSRPQDNQQQSRPQDNQQQTRPQINEQQSRPQVNQQQSRPESSSSFTGTRPFAMQRPTAERTTKHPEYYQGDFPIKLPGSSGFTTTTLKHITKAEQMEECGRVTLKAKPLISHGQHTTEGEWPWHLAIYRSEGVYLSYICGGSLLSKEFVITAAHCVAKPNTNEASNLQGLLLYLGTTNLKQFSAGIQVHQAKKAHIHPDYNHTTYYNDVALLKLSRLAEFTDFVRPVCLWEDDTEISSLIGHLGTVIGWGYDENNIITDSLMQVKMPIVSLSTCIYSNRIFFSTYTFEKTFCAGFRNGSSVCNGDSGGGMVLPKSDNPDIWQLRGIVSIGVVLQGSNTCDPSHYIVFTDIAKHLDWIKRVMR